jgi:pimeloyl-ACP methyl ester carboxylesterase
MCDGRQWAPQAAAFSASRTIVLQSLAGAASVEALAAQALAEAPPRFALAGLSMGGIVAMEVVRQAPHRVERLALLDTNPLPEAEAVKAQRRARMARVAEGHLAEVMRDEMKPLYLAEGPRRADILDLCLDMALMLGPEAFARQSPRPDGPPRPARRLARLSRPHAPPPGRRGTASCPPPATTSWRPLCPTPPASRSRARATCRPWSAPTRPTPR